jgi:hypothetical protein
MGWDEAFASAGLAEMTNRLMLLPEQLSTFMESYWVCDDTRSLSRAFRSIVHQHQVRYFGRDLGRTRP